MAIKAELLYVGLSVDAKHIAEMVSKLTGIIFHQPMEDLMHPLNNMEGKQCIYLMNR